jgi:Ni/Co efflux regulator RcnB
MKRFILAAALSASSMALAQTATQTTTQDMAPPAGAQSTAQPSGQTVDDPSQSTGPRGVTQQGTVPDGQTGANREYPPCSRTVTDGCIQTYEKGVRSSRPRR